MLNKLNRKRPYLIAGAVAGIAAFAVIVFAIGLGLLSAPRTTVSHNTKIQTVFQPFTSTTASCSLLRKTVVTTDLEEQGYLPSKFTIGDGPFKSLGLVDDTGSADFSAQPILNSTDLEAYLTSGSPSAEAQIQQAMTNTGATNAQVLDIENWEGFQLLTPTTWSRNTMYVNGQVEPGPVLHVPAGDIGWMFVSPADCGSTTSTVISSVKTYITRGPCGNEEMSPPTPYIPPQNTPTPPPKPTPKSSCGCTTKTQVEIPPQATPSSNGKTGSPTPTAPTSPPSQSPDPPTPTPAEPTPPPIVPSPQPTNPGPIPTPS